MMTMDDYTQITWQDVRKGDLLMHENGDRLTVESATYANLTGGTFRVTVATRAFGTGELERIGFTPYRRKPEMPSELGAFADKDGEVVLHYTDDDCGILTWFDGRHWRSPGEMEHRAPFTRLVPLPTEEQVRKALFEADVKARLSVSDATAAVMAMLTGKETNNG